MKSEPHTIKVSALVEGYVDNQEEGVRGASFADPSLVRCAHLRPPVVSLQGEAAGVKIDLWQELSQTGSPP